MITLTALGIVACGLVPSPSGSMVQEGLICMRHGPSYGTYEVWGYGRPASNVDCDLLATEEDDGVGVIVLYGCPVRLLLGAPTS